MRHWLPLFMLCGCAAYEAPANDTAATLAVSGDQVIEPPNARPVPISINGGAGGNGHAETWDGRIFIGNFGNGWGVTVFRPERVAADGGTTDAGTPSFEGAFTPALTFDPVISPAPSPRAITSACPSPTPFPGYAFDTTASRVIGKNALAIIPARNRPVNPYKCDNNGNDAAGPNECYDLIVVTLDYPPPPPGQTAGNPVNALGEFHARIIVENPGTPQAQLLGNTTATGTRIDSQLRPYHVSRWRSGTSLDVERDTSRQRDDRLLGIEPTLTADGRLMIWNGAVSNTTTDACASKGIGTLVYSWNATPENPDTWTEPLDVPSMQVDRGRDVAGVLFEERFPIAQKPMLAADGTAFSTFTKPQLYGAYPWLSLDGSELVFPAVPRSPVETRDGATHAAVSIVGRWTNGAIRHIDGPTNPSRLALRLFYSSPGARPSFWTPYPTLRDPLRPLPIPYTAGRPVYPLFGSNSNDYSEVSLEDSVDGDYVLSLHMNEMVGTRADNSGCVNFYDLSRTPDTSGNFNTATLVGASFPGQDRPATASTPAGCSVASPDTDQNGYAGCADPECYGAESCRDAGTPRCEGSCASGACQDAMGFCMDGKSQRGFAGQAIQFPPGAYVRVNDSASLRSAEPYAITPDLSTELAVYGASSASGCFAGGYRLATHNGRWYLAVDAAGNLVATVYSGGQLRTLQTAFPINCRSWTHVAFTYSAATGKLQIYVGGTKRGERIFGAGALDLPTGPLDIGPGTGGSGGTPVLLLDELKVSRVVRTDAEIARSAYLRPQAGALDRSMPLPPGLQAQDTRVPATNPYDPTKVDLGRKLFFDNRLSRNGQLACVSCHDSLLGMSDGYSTGRGLDGRVLVRRASAAINRALSWAQFWDGRAASLEEQVLAPLQNPNEMGFSVDEALTLIRETPDYNLAFSNLFGGVSSDGLQRVLAQYLRSLTSGAAPADGTLSGSAFNGKMLFFGKARCSACHRGSNYTDELFHATFTTPFVDRGRAAITGRSGDERSFKTPSLRDVAMRRFFFHDGSATSLAEVIGRYNTAASSPGRDPEIRPLNLSDDEKRDLEAFLNALTGSQRPSGLVPPLPVRTPSAQLRNASFDSDVSYWTVVGGYYQYKPVPRQAWLSSETDLGNGRAQPMQGIAQLVPTPAQPASAAQSMQLGAGVRNLRARVSQLLNNGGTVQFTVQVYDNGAWRDLGTSGTIGFNQGWTDVGAPDNLAPYAGRVVTLRVLAQTASGSASAGVCDVQVY